MLPRPLCRLDKPLVKSSLQYDSGAVGIAGKSYFPGQNAFLGVQKLDNLIGWAPRNAMLVILEYSSVTLTLAMQCWRQRHMLSHNQ